MLPNESVPNSGTDLRFPEHTDFRTVVGTTWRESISLQRPRYPLPSGARTNQPLPLNQGRHGVLGGGLGSSPERSPDQPGPSPPGSGAACAGTACPGSTPRALGGAVSSDWGLRLDGAAGCGQRGCWVVTEFPRCPEKPGAYWLLRHGPVTGPWGLLAAGPGGDTVCLLLQKDTSPLDSLSFTALPSLRALSLARKGYSPVHRHTGLRGPPRARTRPQADHGAHGPLANRALRFPTNLPLWERRKPTQRPTLSQRPSLGEPRYSSKCLERTDRKSLKRGGGKHRTSER